MPDYWDAKDAVIDFLDREAPDYQVRENYLNPPSKPKYKASTALGTIGLGGSALTRLRGELNDLMKEAFGELWSRNLGVVSLKAVTTIADLIRLVCSRLRIALPEKEPT